MKYIAIIDSEEINGFSGFSVDKPRVYIHKGQETKEIQFRPCTEVQNMAQEVEAFMVERLSHRDNG